MRPFCCTIGFMHSCTTSWT